ncbi:hypothetical protein SAMN04244547_00531 [Azotobacter vinelandii]|nr:hypothetical protein SAMN04244547_00531 [Azotobacter vinelandii]
MRRFGSTWRICNPRTHASRWRCVRSSQVSHIVGIDGGKQAAFFIAYEFGVLAQIRDSVYGY